MRKSSLVTVPLILQHWTVILQDVPLPHTPMTRAIGNKLIQSVYTVQYIEFVMPTFISHKTASFIFFVIV